MPLLEVKNLSVKYQNALAVENLSFTLEGGEILCIVGESGSGKSTILRAVAGLLPEYASAEGGIFFFGKNLLELSEEEFNALRGKEMGFIFQEPSLYYDPLYTVGYQIEETCKIHTHLECFEKTIGSLRRAGIKEPLRVYNSYPHQLSGGLKQRVNIADATVNEPKLLLADEPTTALDLPTQKRVLELLKRLRAEGKAILLVTHDFGVVWEVADRVLVMKEGKKVEEGSVFEIFEKPKHPYTKKLIDIFKSLSFL